MERLLLGYERNTCQDVSGKSILPRLTFLCESSQVHVCGLHDMIKKTNTALVQLFTNPSNGYGPDEDEIYYIDVLYYRCQVIKETYPSYLWAYGCYIGNQCFPLKFLNRISKILCISNGVRKHVSSVLSTHLQYVDDVIHIEATLSMLRKLLLLLNVLVKITNYNKPLKII